MAGQTDASGNKTRAGWISRYVNSFSAFGLIVAALFVSASLAPSLIPRDPVIQGVLSALSAVAGYWLSLGLLWLWSFLELPLLRGRTARICLKFTLAAATVALCISLWSSSNYQNDLREFLGLSPVDATHAPLVVLVAIPIAIFLREVGRLLGWTVDVISRSLRRLLPRRVSLIASLIIAAVLLTNIVSGTIGRFALLSADAAFLAVDQFIDPDLAEPTDPLSSGGPDSVISWRDLGRQGREFVANGPTQPEITALTGAKAQKPLRIYIGLGAAELPEERAELALAELKRVGAFDRSVLVIATPTGTGWIDEAAVDPLEYLHGGDTAIVTQQYSYLTSYISMFIEPGFSQASASALFEAVYGHWTTLPKDSRPRLYLQGLSLGSYGSEQSVQFYRVLGDPIDGAVWSGPSFQNPQWHSFTRNRDSGSPVWLPRYGDGALVRFKNQKPGPDLNSKGWGPVRLVYLQHASDPVTFFSYDLLFQKPEWLEGPRGSDVSPEVRWYPVITALQLMFDMAGASALGPGLGHHYAASSYIDAWVAVTEPDNWTPGDIDRLKAHFAE